MLNFLKTTPEGTELIDVKAIDSDDFGHEQLEYKTFIGKANDGSIWKWVAFLVEGVKRPFTERWEKLQ